MQRVLIVGAGPTGLTLALCLIRYGIPFDLVEAKGGPCRDSKALALNPLSLHQLELLGYRGIVGAEACRVTRANIFFGDIRLNPIDLRWLDHDHNFFLTQPQSATERELAIALTCEGGCVQWNTEVVAVAPRPDGVEVTLRDARGVVVTHKYDYLVGCDGKRSVVRPALGADFVGAEYPMHFVLGDFDLDWEGNPENAHYFVYDGYLFRIRAGPARKVAGRRQT